MSSYLVGDGLPISIEDLKWVVNDIYGVQISIFEVQSTGQFIRGLVERYQRSARILVSGGVVTDPKIRRFVVAKEIAHIIIDEPEEWSPLGETTIRNAIRERPMIREINNLSASTRSEHYAHAGAVEILYPFEYRSNDRKRLEGGELTIPQLSDYYGLPPFVIEIALETAYHSTVAALMALLDHEPEKNA